MANMKYAPGVRRVVKDSTWFKANHIAQLKLVRLLIVGMFCYAWMHISNEAAIYFAIISVGWILISNPIRKHQSTKPKESGDLGEKFVVAMLDGMLDNKYWIARNILIPNPSSKTGTTEIDILVVGPKRIWCIEVKNNKGKMHVDPRNPFWKVCNGHNQYEMRDPCRQVLSQKIALEKYLKSRGIQSLVGTLVICPNPEGLPSERFGFKDIPIMRNPGTIVEQIKSDKGENGFKQRQVLSKLKTVLRRIHEPSN